MSDQTWAQTPCYAHWQRVQSIDLSCTGNEIQLNLFTTATLATEESGHCKELGGCCGEVLNKS